MISYEAINKMNLITIYLILFSVIFYACKNYSRYLKKNVCLIIYSYKTIVMKTVIWQYFYYTNINRYSLSLLIYFVNIILYIVCYKSIIDINIAAYCIKNNVDLQLNIIFFKKENKTLLAFDIFFSFCLIDMAKIDCLMQLKKIKNKKRKNQ